MDNKGLTEEYRGFTVERGLTVDMRAEMVSLKRSETESREQIYLGALVGTQVLSCVVITCLRTGLRAVMSSLTTVVTVILRELLRLLFCPLI